MSQIRMSGWSGNRLFESSAFEIAVEIIGRFLFTQLYEKRVKKSNKVFPQDFAVRT